MIEDKIDRPGKLLLWILTLSVIAVIAVSTYQFLYLKNYSFYIEASCDPTTETCFYRDCSSEECPPNGLSNYKLYLVNASDFSKCSDDSCSQEIESGKINYEEVFCGNSEEDVCSTINTQTEEADASESGFEE